MLVVRVVRVSILTRKSADGLLLLLKDGFRLSVKEICTTRILLCHGSGEQGGVGGVDYDGLLWLWEDVELAAKEVEKVEAPHG